MSESDLEVQLRVFTEAAEQALATMYTVFLPTARAMEIIMRDAIHSIYPYRDTWRKEQMIAQ